MPTRRVKEPLVPCPWCGCVPGDRHIDKTDPDWPRSDVWVVKCTVGQPHAGEYFAGISHWCGLVHVEVDVHDPDKERAVERVRSAWNRRIRCRCGE